MSEPVIQIGERQIGPGHPVYIVAEMSANHGHSLERALELVHAMKDSGADACKVQTYRPDTVTIDSDAGNFRVGGTIWKGRKLFDLYEEAFTPWEWQPEIKEEAEKLGLDFFSTPFDATAIEFLQDLGVVAHKVASFENVDLPLLRRIAATGKPIIMSTGMATLAEIDEAVRTLAEAGGEEIVLLKCTSAYPAPVDEMNLRTLPHLAQAFGVPVGLSDHSMELAVPVTAVGLGACVVEKHLTLDRAVPGPDSEFSLEPDEFRAMVDAVRTTERALGRVDYGVAPSERDSRALRRSLFVVRDVRAGERFTEENVRSIRPGDGLHTRVLDVVLGRPAPRDIGRGTPLSWDLVMGGQ